MNFLFTFELINELYIKFMKVVSECFKMLAKNNNSYSDSDF